MIASPHLTECDGVTAIPSKEYSEVKANVELKFSM